MPDRDPTTPGSPAGRARTGWRRRRIPGGGAPIAPELDCLGHPLSISSYGSAHLSRHRDHGRSCPRVGPRTRRRRSKAVSIWCRPMPSYGTRAISSSPTSRPASRSIRRRRPAGIVSLTMIHDGREFDVLSPPAPRRDRLILPPSRRATTRPAISSWSSSTTPSRRAHAGRRGRSSADAARTHSRRRHVRDPRRATPEYPSTHL